MCFARTVVSRLARWQGNVESVTKQGRINGVIVMEIPYFEIGRKEWQFHCPHEDSDEGGDLHVGHVENGTLVICESCMAALNKNIE